MYLQKYRKKFGKFFGGTYSLSTCARNATPSSAKSEVTHDQEYYFYCNPSDANGQTLAEEARNKVTSQKPVGRHTKMSCSWANSPIASLCLAFNLGTPITSQAATMALLICCEVNNMISVLDLRLLN